MERRIIVVDSNQDQLDMIRMEWERHQTQVQFAHNMIEALELMLKRDFILAMIAEKSTEYMPLLKLMREMKPMPILILASVYDADEKIEAIHRGADEYIEWPQSVNEQLASAKALIRRYTKLNHIKPPPTVPLMHKNLLVNPEFRKAYYKDTEIMLTKNDFDLLYLLLLHPGRVYSNKQIYAYLYGYNEEILAGNVTNSIRSQINRLRNKLRRVAQEDYIETVREVGYQIKI